MMNIAVFSREMSQLIVVKQLLHIYQRCKKISYLCIFLTHPASVFESCQPQLQPYLIGLGWQFETCHYNIVS